jgi:hypothetical protein
MVITLWSFAVFLAAVFGALITAVTLKPKYPHKVMIPAWAAIGIIAYVMTWFSYSVNLTDDTFGIIGLSAVVCLEASVLYKGHWSEKLFVALTACLIDNVATFMFCGTTDALFAGKLGLIKESPYEVPNLLFFIVIKVVVYSLIFFFYFKFLRKHFQAMIDTLAGKMATFVMAPLVSVIGFYIINVFTNQNGIFPGSFWFFPLYLTICLIFVIEFCLLFYSVLWSSRAIKNEAELSVATNIQQSMLPCIFPAFPDRKEIDIFVTMDPAKEVGGDFYDFFMVDETHLAIVVADVSGKGVPAALFMVIGKTLIKDHTQPGRDLGAVFEEVNDLLCGSKSEALFITAFEAVLDLRSGEMTYVNAGHEQPTVPCFVRQ